MNDRQKRLIEVYDYMRKHYSVHTKSDFACALNYGRTSMAAAMGGKDAYLTDKLFTRICEVWPVFNLDYLLTGEGELTLPGADSASKESESDVLRELKALREDYRVELELLRQERQHLQDVVRHILGTMPAPILPRPYAEPEDQPLPYAAEGSNVSPSDTSSASPNGYNVSPQNPNDNDK